MGGGGGFVGSVQNQALNYGALESGYATVGTDTGHTGTGIDASWALNNLERVVNFGHQAVHRTAVTAKSMVSHYYQDDIEKNYFVGCSRGGGQALMEAQRYPNDFDGIVAGAPAYSWTGLAAQTTRINQAMYPNPSSLEQAVISPTEGAILESMILSRCDADDGIEDGILNDPRQCDFNIEELPSCSSVDNDECFTQEEKAAISVTYDGPLDAFGESLFYGFPFGGESDPRGWGDWLTGGVQHTTRTDGSNAIPSAHYGFGNGIMKYLVFHDPQWNYTSYDFQTFKADVAAVSSTLNATDPDISTFRDNGGKLLIYQGWSDAAISGLATIGYYNEVLIKDPSAKDDVGLYMMPGVLHCSGGAGPSVVNFLDVIDQWVTTGEQPQELVATFPPGPNQRVGSRPLCPFPQLAQYDGSGDVFDPSNFSCVNPD